MIYCSLSASSAAFDVGRSKMMADWNLHIFTFFPFFWLMEKKNKLFNLSCDGNQYFITPGHGLQNPLHSPQHLSFVLLSLLLPFLTTFSPSPTQSQWNPVDLKLWVIEWMMDEWIGWCMDGWIDIWVDRWVDEQMCCGWVEGWTDGRTDGWMEYGWMDGLNRSMNERTDG